MIAFDTNYDDASLDADTECMIRVAAGDHAAFDELVHRNFHTTVRIITSMMGSASYSEDLAQDVFLRIYRSRQRYLPTAKFSTFLGTVIRNTVLNAKRSLSRRRVHATEFVDDGSAIEAESGVVVTPRVEYDLAKEMDEREIGVSVKEAIACLPHRQRDAIELVHFAGMTYVRAAQEMETSRKAVKSLLGRGRASLERSLKGEYQRRFDPGTETS